MITQDSIEALKSRLDIVDVVGSYIELKKAGVNYKALCPFHGEKSPSFVVSPKKQIYHCFSCGAGGDSIKFVIEYEKLTYPEALEKLASTYNFSLSYSEAKNFKPNSNIFAQINDYYKSLLNSNNVALNYLKQRGIYESSIEKFEIGYAPYSDSTINFIKTHFLNMNEALEAGIIGGEGGRYYARFIDRITFPIYSANSTLVGFGGRTISNHQAKYINSPETKYFNKSRLLYAYNIAKDGIYKTKEIIITEGYLDVIMLHQAGFSNAVATLGTALTPEHLPLLRKGEPRIVMAYDGDKAGRAAALKASKLLSISGFSGGVVIFRDGKDPADMVNEGASEELSKMFREAKPFIEFVLDEILLSYDLRDPKAKESCMQDSVSYLKSLSPFLQEQYKTYLASRLGGVSPSLIKVTSATNTYKAMPLINSAKHKDIWELTLIKTVIEHPEFIDMILDVLEPSLLQFHSYEFELVLASKHDEPQIVAIAIDDKIPVIGDEESLKSELSNFLIKHYEREAKKINMQKDISFEQKAFLIRKYRDTILRLKKGEFVKV